MPQKLFDQVKEQGRLVIPIGPAETQELQLIRKVEGKPVVVQQIGCRFVPLIGEQGYRED
jgi:protein-L-isoaspartate(D-aspartate) O-methyltransferase